MLSSTSSGTVAPIVSVTPSMPSNEAPRRLARSAVQERLSGVPPPAAGGLGLSVASTSEPLVDAEPDAAGHADEQVLDAERQQRQRGVLEDRRPPTIASTASVSNVKPTRPETKPKMSIVDDAAGAEQRAVVVERAGSSWCSALSGSAR